MCSYWLFQIYRDALPQSKTQRETSSLIKKEGTQQRCDWEPSWSSEKIFEWWTSYCDASLLGQIEAEAAKLDLILAVDYFTNITLKGKITVFLNFAKYGQNH